VDCSQITIRLAQPEDAVRIADLCSQLGYPATADAVRERLAEIGQDERHAVFVAEGAGRVAGWIHVYLCPLVVVGLQAEIGGLVVDENWRGRGVGRLLLEWAEQWVRERGVQDLVVRSNVVRERAHAFYERAGYICFKTSRVFRKRL
jgi:GNAT superfamily N-acetyltransferase